MEYLKKIFKNYWILSVFCIVLGIAFIIKPDFFLNAVGYAVGGIILAFGIIDLIRYFISGRENPEYSFCLVKGIVISAVGIFILIKPDFIPKIIAVTCGIYMLLSGIVSIQDSLNLKNAGIEGWKQSLIPAAITTGLGLVLLFNPLAPVNIMIMILGVALLFSGIMNVIGCFSVNGKMKDLNKVIKSGHRNDKDDFIDI